MQAPNLFISIMIVLIIGLHTLPVLQELRGSRQTFWPIMAWGRYRKSYDTSRSIKTSVRRIIGITIQNHIVQVSAFDADQVTLDFIGYTSIQCWQEIICCSSPRRSRQS